MNDLLLPRPRSFGQRARGLGVLLLLSLVLSGCSIRKLAVNSLANALAAGGDVYATEEDIELVRESMPFGLKTIESLLASNPEHRGLLLAACKGFMTYSYAFVQLDGERLRSSDYRRAEALEARALALQLRARDYCLRSLEQVRPGVQQALQTTPEQALAAVPAAEVGLLFWTAAAWGGAISLGLDRPELVIDLPAVRALVERGLALDPDWDGGVLHELMISIEAVPETMGGSLERARQHFDQALALSGGQRASTYVTWANSVTVRQQDRGEFERRLEEALAVESEVATNRFRNAVGKEWARVLLAQADDLFLSEESEELEP